ncbi:uncharacterized protein [Spinacia oleracea]|uniref:Endonuclease/exonuclease/phosphatase domain-containing protein n=1 Tax=Spinacia oleracea TaxID=3562 RepID=A0ABM3QQ34_SPIOL|nr:uncharacterized protein LOC130461407 [Spinacia oleracea]
MDRVLSWNVRGLNLIQKQDIVRQLIHKYHVGLVGLLEHKVKTANLGKLYQRMFSTWCFTSNASYHDGGRIIVAWNPNSFIVTIIVVTSQFVHCSVTPVGSTTKFLCTFIYAFNENNAREELWRDLRHLNTHDPWVLCGDFNCVMALDERIGAPVRTSEITSMCDCMQYCGMEDVKSVGNLYTWNNKQQGMARVFSKIDRIMANTGWQNEYGSAEACFMNEGSFDHSPGLLTVYPRNSGGKKPFKYFTMWRNALDFNTIVQEQWNTQIQGSKMFTVVTKLKKVKAALKELNRAGFSDVHAADLKAHHEMIAAQNAMHLNPTDQALADAELQAVQEYRTKHKAYLEFLRQKAKLEWLKAGDENTALFHQSIRSRNTHNQIYSIHDMNGVWTDTADGVSKAFLDFYSTLLGSTHSNRTDVLSQIVQAGPMVTDQHKQILNAPYTYDEVKKALFSIPGIKARALGPSSIETHGTLWERM